MTENKLADAANEAMVKPNGMSYSVPQGWPEATKDHLDAPCHIRLDGTEKALKCDECGEVIDGGYYYSRGDEVICARCVEDD